MIRDALADPSKWQVEAFRAAQTAAAEELAAAGNPWVVSDFVTLGSPLTHAEFLIARDREHLVEGKAQRVLPCCPPVLEYDGNTRLRHFTYRPWSVAEIGEDGDPGAPRMPHHAALFAYTRWTNIHSPARFVLWGDLISGPVGDVFGLETGDGVLRGVKDVAVMPQPRGSGTPGLDDRRPFFTHTKYWDERAVGPAKPTPRHIRELRDALRLGD
jgi:hypothetical protein